ncbi:MAG TPA: DUF6378 domain-containing protein [Acidimicrobiia bacterium]
MTMMNREDGTMTVVQPLLDEVGEILEERQAEYGDSADHHRRTAQVWSALFGWEVGPDDVCMAIAADKMVRRRTSPGKRDHYADIIGYVVKAHDRAMER